MRTTRALLGALVLLVPSWLEARPVDRKELLRFEALPENGQESVTGVWGTAAAGTTYFGGTVWAPDSMRWEAIEGGTWTFDSGVGSHFDHSAPHVNPYKNVSLNAYMEGWIGIDNSYSEITYFRRLGESDFAGVDVCVGEAGGLEGEYSFWAGVLPEESDSPCYAGGQGYGNAWYVCIEREFAYNGSGPVTWEYNYVADTEPGFDYTYAIVDTSGSGDEVVAMYRDGVAAGRDSLTLIPGVMLRSNAGPIVLKFCVRSDGAYSDEDGLYPTACGALAVDAVAVQGGGIAHATGFETGEDGWALSPSQPGPGGDWSSLVDVSTLPPVVTVCPCVGGVPGASLSDSVLVFEDLTISGHNSYQDNMAASPWIDLKAAGLVGVPFKQMYFEGYTQLPLLDYIFVQQWVQWYPDVCPATGRVATSPWTTDGFVYYFGGVPTCRPDTNPVRLNFGSVIDVGAEQVRMALGVLSYCRFFGNCTGNTNSSPWFDNVRFCVFGVPGAPSIATRTIDVPQDAFPENGALLLNGPGRLDSNNVKGEVSPERSSSLGDTLIVQGGASNMEVYVVFAVEPGPGVNTPAFNAWLASHATHAGPTTLPKPGGGTRAVTWYQARMDTAEQGGIKTTGSWMTAYHEGDPNFSGTDTSLDPGDLAPNGQARLANDIFPDDLFTPGTRVDLYYRARFIGSSSWFELPGVGMTGALPLEWECLPSSMGADSTFNCVLYVDHQDGRGADPFIDHALLSILGMGSSNAEGTNWDRFDVRAPTSQQGSFGRPPNTEYGAALNHILGYDTILWSSGDLEAFALSEEDASILIPWLTLYGGPDGSKLYLTGNGIAATMTLGYATEPSALALLNDYCGVLFSCGVVRDSNCPPGGVRDTTACMGLDPVPGSLVASGLSRSLQHLAQGNGCPQNRSYDVLLPLPGPNAAPVADERYTEQGGGPVPYSSVASTVSGTHPYRTVVDGASVHYRRDATRCTFDGSAGPVEERMQEVLGFLGYPSGEVCSNTYATTDVPELKPQFVAALHPATPNPLRGGPARLTFTLSRRGPASVNVFDIQGRSVREVFEGIAEEGDHKAVWDGRNGQGESVAAGVYFYRLEAEGRTWQRKLVVMPGAGQ